MSVERSVLITYLADASNLEQVHAKSAESARSMADEIDRAQKTINKVGEALKVAEAAHAQYAKEVEVAQREVERLGGAFDQANSHLTDTATSLQAAHGTMATSTVAIQDLTTA